MRNLFMVLTVFIILSLVGCDYNEQKYEKNSRNNISSKSQHNNEKEIRKRLKEISDLHEKLETKKSEISSARIGFVQEIDGLKEEIINSKEIYDVNDFKDAQNNYRVKNNLILIQQRLAYVSKLKQVELGILNGSEEILFLKRKTEGDLKMVEVLDEEEISSLISQIDNVIAKYLPYANELVIDTSNIELKDTKKTWDEIMFQKEKEKKAIQQNWLNELTLKKNVYKKIKSDVNVGMTRRQIERILGTPSGVGPNYIFYDDFFIIGDAFGFDYKDKSIRFCFKGKNEYLILKEKDYDVFVDGVDKNEFNKGKQLAYIELSKYLSSLDESDKMMVQGVVSSSTREKNFVSLNDYLEATSNSIYIGTSPSKFERYYSEGSDRSFDLYYHHVEKIVNEYPNTVVGEYFHGLKDDQWSVYRPGYLVDSLGMKHAPVEIVGVNNNFEFKTDKNIVKRILVVFEFIDFELLGKKAYYVGYGGNLIYIKK